MKEVYVNILRDHFGLAPVGREDFEWNAVLKKSYPTIYQHLLEFADTEKPYEAPSSMENTTEAHMANWNRLSTGNSHSLGPSIWAELLKVHTSADRIPLKVPFRSGDWIYASPGIYVVRLPVSFAPEIQVNPDGPGKIEEIFQTQMGPGEWQTFSGLGVLPSPTEERCDTCEGHGVNTLRVGNRYALGESCSSCEGDGKRKVYPKIPVKLLDPRYRVSDERFLLNKTVSMLSLLPDARWKASEDLKLCLGTFAGGYGQFMTALHAEKD